MIEIHPAIVHFPVALLSLAALFAALSLFVKKEFFKEIAFWNLLLGVSGTIAAVITGLLEEQHLVHNDEIHQLLVKHKFTGVTILIFSFCLLIWVWVRKNKFGKQEYILWTLFLVLGTAMVLYQGFLGGRMVFEHGAGIKPMEPFLQKEADSKPHDHSNSSHPHDSVQNNISSPTAKDTIQHEHPVSANKPVTSQDSIKRKDSKPAKEKKKELKEMKY